MSDTTRITLDGDRLFDFSCLIHTAKKFVQLSQSSIIYLEIKESIFNGFPEGILVLDNTNGAIDTVFAFSGDPVIDLLAITLIPAEEPGRGGDFDRNFNIEDIFTIYRVDDIPTGEYPAGAKKLYFRHALANEMHNKKNSLTVEDFFDESDISNLTDNERAVKTGVILKKLLGKDEDKKGGDIPRTADFTIKEDEWDEGKYSMYPNWCPSTETLFDSIHKVYKKHISSEEPFDRCYLQYDRFDKNLSLISMAKLLKKNIDEEKKFFLETLVLGTLGADGGEEGGVSDSPPAGLPKSKVDNDSILLDLSNIRAFKFIDLSSEILEKDLIINIPAVTDFDNTTRFNLGEKDTKDAFDKYKKYYVTDPFDKMVEGGSAEPTAIWINSRKKINTQYNKTIISPFKSWEHAHDVDVKASILNTFLTKGLRCMFSLRGATHRTIGKFVDIQLKDNVDTIKFAKIPGRWLVTECSHIITKDKYWNSLSCIKTYRNF